MAKSIFITGAAQGIGRATAVKFHKAGWYIGAYDIDGVGLAKLAEELGGDRIQTGALDVTDRAAFTEATASFNAQAGGRFDVLFNNAGLLFTGDFGDIAPEKHDKLIDVNCKGVVNGITAALPYLEATAEKEGGANIISMCSASAIFGTPEHVVYSATKFFVRSITEGLSIELAPKNIKVADIMPSYVDTGMVNNLEHKPKILQTNGISHSADDIADMAWQAVHGDKVHVLGSGQFKMLDALSGIAPNYVAGRMKKMMGE